MIFRKNKNLFNKVFLSQIALTIVGFMVLILISVPLARNMSKRYKVNDEINDLQREISDLEGRNTELKDLVKYLNSDSFVEEQAKLKLNYKEEGEEVFIIKDIEGESGEFFSNKNKSSYNILGLNKNEAREKNNIIKWWNYFFGT
jgi:cell division protein FtsB